MNLHKVPGCDGRMGVCHVCILVVFVFVVVAQSGGSPPKAFICTVDHTGRGWDKGKVQETDPKTPSGQKQNMEYLEIKTAGASLDIPKIQVF